MSCFIGAEGLCHERRLPHLGQNFTSGGSVAPHLAQVSEPLSRWPQLPQNAAPGAVGALHAGHDVGDGVCPSCVPQLTHRRECGLLSVPQFGQGLYLLPQFGQKADVEGYFFPQFEQYTILGCCGCGVVAGACVG